MLLGKIISKRKLNIRKLKINHCKNTKDNNMKLVLQIVSDAELSVDKKIISKSRLFICRQIQTTKGENCEKSRY